MVAWVLNFEPYRIRAQAATHSIPNMWPSFQGAIFSDEIIYNPFQKNAVPQPPILDIYHEICMVIGSTPQNNQVAPGPWNEHWKIPRTLRSCFERGPRGGTDFTDFTMKIWTCHQRWAFSSNGLLSIQCLGCFPMKTDCLFRNLTTMLAFPSRCTPSDLRSKVAG